MKLSSRVTMLSAIALASASLTFADGEQHIVRSAQTDKQAAQGAPRAIQQGKGAGMTRNTVDVNASRVQTENDRQTVRRDPSALPRDSGYRK